jgi:hypothetical protein
LKILLFRQKIEREGFFGDVFGLAFGENAAMSKYTKFLGDWQAGGELIDEFVKRC